MTSPFGRLQHFLDDSEIQEIMIIAGKHLWVEDASGIHFIEDLSTSDVAMVLEAISRYSQRRTDLLSPITDAVLPCGSRACVVIAPIAVDGATVSIRKFARRIHPLAAFGTHHSIDIVRRLIAERKNVVIAGATSTGKTSLLSSVTQHFSSNERIVCVEDTSELKFTHPHVVRLQTRPPNSEGNGAIALHDLVRASLRLRPDRLIVGEVRSHEALDMLLALSSGHRGCWSTIHATSAFDTLQRLNDIVVRGSIQWSTEQVQRLVTSSVDAIVYLHREPNRRRRITEIVQRNGTEYQFIFGGHE